jgi:hypothetical protein
MKTTSRPNEEHTLLRPFDDGIALQKGQEMAELLQEWANLEAQQKALKAQAKALDDEIDIRKGQLSALKEDLRRKKHGVKLVCKWSMVNVSAAPAGAKGKLAPDVIEWHLKASDGELVRREPTTEADRQGQISFPKEEGN